jgi:hypothetical protein
MLKTFVQIFSVIENEQAFFKRADSVQKAILFKVSKQKNFGNSILLSFCWIRFISFWYFALQYSK